VTRENTYPQSGDLPTGARSGFFPLKKGFFLIASDDGTFKLNPTKRVVFVGGRTEAGLASKGMEFSF
jgi:hypothetical protein